MVMFGFFFHGTNFGWSKRINVKNHVHIFQHVQPACGGLVGYLHVIAQCVYRKWRTHQIGQSKRKLFQQRNIPDIFQGAQFITRIRVRYSRLHRRVSRLDALKNGSGNPLYCIKSKRGFSSRSFTSFREKG